MKTVYCIDCEHSGISTNKLFLTQSLCCFSDKKHDPVSGRLSGVDCSSKRTGLECVDFAPKKKGWLKQLVSWRD